MRRSAEHLSDLVLEEIGRDLRSDDGEYVYVLDIDEGDVLMFERWDWPEYSDDDLDEDGDPSGATEQQTQARAVWADTTGRYVPIPTRPSRRLDRFCENLPPGKLADEVREASRGRGAFRRVKDLLARQGKLDLWQAFEERADIEDARDWLRSEGLLPGDDDEADAPS